jgi:hypothetical protein
LSVHRAVLEFTQCEELLDDVTVAIIKVEPPPAAADV